MIFQPSTDSRHIPVMLMESLENLNIKNSGIYVDGTFTLKNRIVDKSVI